MSELEVVATRICGFAICDKTDHALVRLTEAQAAVEKAREEGVLQVWGWVRHHGHCSPKCNCGLDARLRDVLSSTALAALKERTG